MGKIIEMPGVQRRVIDVRKVEYHVERQLPEGLIACSSGNIVTPIAEEHAAEPIKSIDDIEKVSRYLIENGKYRDNMLFILGINFGLRISDLLQLRFCTLIDENLTFRTTFPILEKKTRNTRKHQRNRYISINEAVVEAVTLFLQHNECTLDDYLFKCESNRGGHKNVPLDRSSVDRILKKIAREVGLTERVSTHTLRKTFGYHQMVMSGNDPRKLLLLQKIFGHSTSAQTLDYIGITEEEITDAYLGLNLGSRNSYRRMNQIHEVSYSA